VVVVVLSLALTQVVVVQAAVLVILFGLLDLETRQPQFHHKEIMAA
jgi:hypothetical protein